MSRLDYSKWDHIEVSDDEDDTHPNIDTPSLFRWRHQARVERMEKTEQEKAALEAQKKEQKQKVRELTEKLKATSTAANEDEAKKLQVKMADLKKQEEDFRRKEEELAKKERLTPWNVDTLSKDGFEKTIINKPKKAEELSEDEKHKRMLSFIDEHEKEIKKFGMIKDYDRSSDFLRDNPHLVCSDTASYLTLWCVTLEVEEKHSLMTLVAHQAIVMQYILELAKQLDADPRSCVTGFFKRIKSAEKQYTDAFKDELDGFIKRVELRAQARIEEATRKAEEEERQKRLGPGGLDPLDVIETLPPALKECFETKNVPMLQQVLASLPREEAAYHMQRCVDSGLWVTDAKSAGLTPASEELSKMEKESGGGGGGDQEGAEDSDEFYETVEEAAEDTKEADLDLD